MQRGEFIENLVEQGKVPGYVTQEHLGKIFDIIDSGKQHPNSSSCDMVIEMAAGVPLRDSVKRFVKEGCKCQSLYDDLYKHYNLKCMYDS
mgnify:CR=1 FL=1|jgi:hypothetical protein